MARWSVAMPKVVVGADSFAPWKSGCHDESKKGLISRGNPVTVVGSYFIVRITSKLWYLDQTPELRAGTKAFGKGSTFNSNVNLFASSDVHDHLYSSDKWGCQTYAHGAIQDLVWLKRVGSHAQSPVILGLRREVETWIRSNCDIDSRHGCRD